jgi:hypothetical protein
MTRIRAAADQFLEILSFLVKEIVGYVADGFRSPTIAGNFFKIYNVFTETHKRLT